MKTAISKDFSFDMAHRLTFHEGLCRNIHGHTYRLDVTLEGDPDSRGMIMDYADLKSLVHELIIEKLDHALAVYEQDSLLMGKFDPSLKQIIFPFETTAENLVAWIFREISRREPRLAEVTLWETPGNKAVCTR